MMPGQGAASADSRTDGQGRARRRRRPAAERRDSVGDGVRNRAAVRDSARPAFAHVCRKVTPGQRPRPGRSSASYRAGSSTGRIGQAEAPIYSAGGGPALLLRFSRCGSHNKILRSIRNGETLGFFDTPERREARPQHLVVSVRWQGSTFRPVFEGMPFRWAGQGLDPCRSSTRLDLQASPRATSNAPGGAWLLAEKGRTGRGGRSGPDRARGDPGGNAQPPPRTPGTLLASPFPTLSKSRGGAGLRQDPLPH